MTTKEISFEVGYREVLDDKGEKVEWRMPLIPLNLSEYEDGKYVLVDDFFCHIQYDPETDALDPDINPDKFPECLSVGLSCPVADVITIKGNTLERMEDTKSFGCGVCPGLGNC